MWSAWLAVDRNQPRAKRRLGWTGGALTATSSVKPSRGRFLWVVPRGKIAAAPGMPQRQLNQAQRCPSQPGRGKQRPGDTGLKRRSTPLTAVRLQSIDRRLSQARSQVQRGTGQYRRGLQPAWSAPMPARLSIPLAETHQRISAEPQAKPPPMPSSSNSCPG